MKFINKLLRDEQGATAIEYGLIAALIGVVIIVGAGQVGTALNTKFLGIAGDISGAGASAGGGDGG